MDKKTLREIFLNERLNVPKNEFKMLNHMLMVGLKEELKNHDLNQVAVFYPMGGEVDVRALASDYDLAYPKVESSGLVFYHKVSSFKPSAFGVMEPNDGKRLNKDDIDAVIVPGIVYDDGLYRLGYGKGYYDRFLKDYAGLTVGVVFERFRVEALPNQPHDVPVNILVTDNQIYDSRHDDYDV